MADTVSVNGSPLRSDCEIGCCVIVTGASAPGPLQVHTSLRYAPPADDPPARTHAVRDGSYTIAVNDRPGGPSAATWRQPTPSYSQVSANSFWALPLLTTTTERTALNAIACAYRGLGPEFARSVQLAPSHSQVSPR